MTSLAIKPKDPEKTDFENPEWTDDMFANAIRLQGLPISLQAKLGNPPKANPKQAITVHYDSDIIDRFRATGKGWQARMNDALREYLDTHAF